jgi:hypothetical protein
MTARDSIFFDLNLPNPTTWFYFSALLAVALFFKFSRLWSIRNLDVLMLFLPMPGLLLLVPSEAGPHHFAGYLALLIAAGYWLLRCLLDLALVRRPALEANLNLGGLAWLSGALFVSLVAVAARQPHVAQESGAGPRPPIDRVREFGEKAIRPYTPPTTVKHWVERGLAVACHLSIVVGLVLIGWRHFEDIRLGMSAATFYLLMPYTYLLLPGTEAGLGRWDQPWPMALLVWAIFSFRWPTLAGAFLGVSVGTVLFPVVTVPAWLSFYRRRGANRFLLALVLSSGFGLVVLGILSLANGELPSSLTSAWTTSDWQPWKQPSPDTPGLWTSDFWSDLSREDVPPPREEPSPDRGIDDRMLTNPQPVPAHESRPRPPERKLYRIQSAYRLPLFIAYAALVIITGFWPSPKNLAHLIALSATVLLGIQFWYSDRGGVYVLWYLPLLLLLVFRPNLSATLPPLAPPDDRLVRLTRRFAARVRGWLRMPESTAPAPTKPDMSAR